MIFPRDTYANNYPIGKKYDYKYLKTSYLKLYDLGSLHYDYMKSI